MKDQMDARNLVAALTALLMAPADAFRRACAARDDEYGWGRYTPRYDRRYEGDPGDVAE